MRKINFAIALSILLGIIIIACEKTVSDFKIDPSSPRMVVNAKLNPDSVVKVHLSKSMSIAQIGSTFPAITDAKVILYEDETLIGQLSHSVNGIYILDGFKPQPGKRYTLEAQAESLKKITAQTTIPFSSCISLTDSTLKRSNYDNYTNYLFNATLEITGDNSQMNYFSMKILNRYRSVVYKNPYDCQTLINEYGYTYESCKYEQIDTLYSYVFNTYSTTDRNVKFYDIYGDNEVSNMDALKKSSEMYFKADIKQCTTSFSIQWYKLMPPIIDTVKVEICSYDASLFNYLYSIAKQQTLEDDYFAEKTQVYTNVENGLGIFGSYTKSEMKIGIKNQ